MKRTVLTSIVAILVLATAAGSQAVASAGSSATTGPTNLTFAADATAPPANGQIPSSLAFSAAGFAFDPRAVSTYCPREKAVLDECPAASRIGVGSLTIHVVSPGFTRNTALPLDIYLQSRTKVFAIAFVGGPKLVPGVLSTSNGVTLSFNPLPKPPPFPGTTLTLLQVNLKLGTSRVAVTKKREKVHGKVETKIVKRTHYYLIHQPASCPGSWTSAITLGFPGGTSAVLPTPIACPSNATDS